MGRQENPNIQQLGHSYLVFLNLSPIHTPRNPQRWFYLHALEGHVQDCCSSLRPPHNGFFQGGPGLLPLPQPALRCCRAVQHLERVSAAALRALSASRHPTQRPQPHQGPKQHTHSSTHLLPAAPQGGHSEQHSRKTPSAEWKEGEAARPGQPLGVLELPALPQARGTPDEGSGAAHILILSFLHSKGQ